MMNRRVPYSLVILIAVVGVLAATLSVVQAQISDSPWPRIYVGEHPDGQIDGIPGDINYVNWEWSHTSDPVSWSAEASLQSQVRQAIAVWETRLPHLDVELRCRSKPQAPRRLSVIGRGNTLPHLPS